MIPNANKAKIALLSALITIALITTFTGCASVPERNPVPADITTKVGIPGIAEARFWGDEWPAYSKERIENYTDAQFRQYLSAIYNKRHNYLAISGGGANGAFGAGLLLGWTESGTRPEFTMVTGISTGALTAPFAFLGPDYDDQLKAVYTTTSTKDILKERNIISGAFSDSMTDTTPLKAMITKHFTSSMIEAIAQEYRGGRRLYIGTANLDAGRSVIWDIGAIAASTNPQREELIHDILRASAAIPVMFPPVVVSVEFGGESYDEMHVDGGTAAQVFVYPAAINWKKIVRKLKVQGDPKVFVIRNSFLEPDYQGIKRKVFPIASRTIESLIRTQGIGDLYQIYALCERDGNDFNLAYIPSDFTEKPTEVFDPVYMGKLFELGYQMAIDGYQWEKSPPGFTGKP
ncbi:MAG: patatin-like phospholipase family protein [Proteobacteria bacterium]|nr:patatin-like phospholipase family protein [Pseudomonadota bacterium]